MVLHTYYSMHSSRTVQTATIRSGLNLPSGFQCNTVQLQTLYYISQLAASRILKKPSLGVPCHVTPRTAYKRW